MNVAERSPATGQLDSRAGRRFAAWSPAQIMALVIGVWWTINGVGAFLIDPNLATGQVHGGGRIFGGVTITVNGWHAVFHLVPGLLGVAVASRPRAALAYSIVAGTSYIVIASWGLLAGGSSVGLIAVDGSGDLVHMAEGLFVVAAGLLTLAATSGPPRRR